jgi:nucleotide-binding universal stress UspA family protein
LRRPSKSIYHQEGVPFKKLVEVAKEEKVDLVVMGTRGRSDIEGILFVSPADCLKAFC